MPEQSYPPFVSGATQVPRTLNRWLDVNPQGGPLKRTQGYLNVPAFNVVPSAWNGYSEIVLAYNFVTTNNFTITDLSALPSNPNYVMTIAYQDSGGVYRYWLAGTGGTFYFSIPAYNGHKIKKNFRIEVWSISANAVTQTSDFKLYTSARGGQDYRFGDDFSLVSTQTSIVNFQCAQGASALPFASDLQLHWRADTGFNLNGASAATWTSMVNAADILTRTGATDPAPLTGGTQINNQAFIDYTSSQKMSSVLSQAYDIGNIFMVFKSPLSGAIAGNVITFDNGGINFSVTSGGGSALATMTITGFNSGGNYAGINAKFSNNFYLLELNQNWLYVYDLASGTLLFTAAAPAGDPFSTANFMLAENRGLDIAELFTYASGHFNTARDYDQLFKYVSDRYSTGMIAMPFAFPDNSSVPTNS